MIERPDYVECIKRPNDKRLSWCGGSHRPFFESIDHAAMNGEKRGRLVACPECVAAIIVALKNGADE